ncbi:MAG: DUF2723 domain-containing protein [Verrucomicrobia bacterium]|nr:DUF2723 domain-containing protein [Verrucomicrobiota bacterium]
MSNTAAKPVKPAPAAPPQSAGAAKGAKPTRPLHAKAVVVPVSAVSGLRPPLFRRIDWLTFGVTTLLTLIGYLLTLAPDLTLEDSGELAVGSYYAAVPHAPGYPVWTIYSWLFTVLLPFSNIAWRVAVSSAVAAAVANGLLGMVVSRGSSMILESIEELKHIDRHWEDELCMVAGFVAAVMIGFNGFMWSQAVIVEVYTLSVLSLMGVLVCLLHWTYAPDQRKYLYIAAFLFGICFNNHQTLIVAAMGIQVLIALVRPDLGRNAFFVNVVFYVLGLLLKRWGVLTMFDQNVPLYVIYNAVGLGSIAGCVWLAYHTKRWKTEWLPVLWTMLAWMGGAAFYFYMPITSATNPPMNWGYPRTFDGFIHAFTRGQYEKTNPTNILEDPWRFLLQVRMYFEGAVEEFHLIFLLLAIVPFLFLARMQKRERAWLIGNAAIYGCLAFLLLILLNPQTDRQSRDLTKVFFTASHVTIAMFLGYGLTLVGALLLTQYQRIRTWILYGGAVAGALALYTLADRLQTVYTDPRSGLTGLSAFFHGLGQALTHAYFTPPVYSVYAALFVLLLVLVFLGVVLAHREQLKTGFVLASFAVIPLYTLVSHWAENEQRGHIFGFWFGHDMFTPPFDLYPEMTRDAILFGGTDPGRFCPTYMIFCESFIKPQHRRDPDFDRRDVYIITQNALADGTYLNYIRAHYHRSAQEDPPFFRDAILYFQSLAMGKKEAERKLRGEFHRTNTLARFIGSFTNVVAPLDRLITNFGLKVEERRRREGVYPPVEAIMPSVDDSQQAFQEYILDAQRRLLHDTQYPNEPKQIRPGEIVNFTPDGRVQVAGQVAVMAINGLLTKVIFDKNPTNEFFVEESFPLEWMYPYLTPYGIILKLNRQPVPEFTEDIVARDRQFWMRYAERLCGNWITPETPIPDICDFVERTYRRGNLQGYTGDPKFVRDNDAQKAFSKLRNSIAGLYAWRLGTSQNPAERNRLIREADFAFKQAFAFCPYSMETVSRYVTLLATLGRIEDALLVAQTAQRFDLESPFAQSLIDQLRQMQRGLATLSDARGSLGNYESQFRSNSNDLQAAFNLAGAYLALQQSNEAYHVLDEFVNQTTVDPSALLSIANAYVQLGQYQRVEPALRKLVALMPERSELWYDLAGAQAAAGKTNEAVQSLTVCLELNQRQRTTDPTVSNLLPMAASDPRFQPLRSLPEFQRLFPPR